MRGGPYGPFPRATLARSREARSATKTGHARARARQPTFPLFSALKRAVLVSSSAELSAFVPLKKKRGRAPHGGAASLGRLLAIPCGSLGLLLGGAQGACLQVTLARPCQATCKRPGAHLQATCRRKVRKEGVEASRELPRSTCEGGDMNPQATSHFAARARGASRCLWAFAYRRARTPNR